MSFAALGASAFPQAGSRSSQGCQIQIERFALRSAGDSSPGAGRNACLNRLFPWAAFLIPQALRPICEEFVIRQADSVVEPLLCLLFGNAEHSSDASP